MMFSLSCCACLNKVSIDPLATGALVIGGRVKFDDKIFMSGRSVSACLFGNRDIGCDAFLSYYLIPVISEYPTERIQGGRSMEGQGTPILWLEQIATNL